MDETGSSRNLWLVIRTQPGAMVAFACAGGLVLLLVIAWVIRVLWGPAPAVVVFDAEPAIRVRIMRSATEVVISEPPMVEIGISLDDVFLMSTPVVIQWLDGVISATDAGGMVHEFAEGEIFIAGAPGRSGETGPLKVGSYRYPDTLRVVARDSGMDVVNDTFVDSYLPGVIAKELFSHWHARAYEVQAVCARGYAMHVLKVGARSDRHFDINAGESSQAYVGITDHARANEAVQSTRGKVLVFAGELVRTYYSSTCGGRSGSAADVWGAKGKDVFNAVEPLDAHERAFACEEAPLYRWSRTRSVRDLSRRLAAFGENWRMSLRKLDRLASIEVVERAVTGRPALYAVTDTDGEVHEISAEEMRLACNYPANRLDRPSDENRVMSNDLVFQVNGSVIEIEGRGFGHGVGMCQYCSQFMAERGETAEEMLGQFYQGAIIERLFE